MIPKNSKILQMLTIAQMMGGMVDLPGLETKPRIQDLSPKKLAKRQKESKIRLEKKDVERRLAQGQKQYFYNGAEFVWARNLKNAERKAKNLNVELI